MLYPRFITIGSFLLLSFTGRAQQLLYNNWYFGENAAITFNTTPPAALTGSQISTGEGSASISDNAGNFIILF
jgi:hypothetical protein